MQDFIDIPSTDSLQNSRLKLVNNDKSIMSCHSGTAFPTNNLQVGMLCLRTDLDYKLYELKDLTPTWVLIADLSKTYTNKEYVDEKISNHGNHVPAKETANNKKFLRNDGTWQDVTPANIGAAAEKHDASAITTGVIAKERGGTGNTTNDAATVGGLAVNSTNTNNTKNQIMRTDGNGYANFGWINTVSGETTNASTHYYVNTNDGYIRKKTLANVKNELGTGNQTITKTKQLMSPEFNKRTIWTNNSANATAKVGAPLPAEFPFTPDETITDSSFDTTTKIGSNTARYNYRKLSEHIGDGIEAGTYTLAGIIQELVNRSHRHIITGNQGHTFTNCNCGCDGCN